MLKAGGYYDAVEAQRFQNSWGKWRK